MSAPSSLRDLPVKLRDDPALGRVLGRSSAVISVPEHGRAFVLAGLAATSARRPFLVAVPTTTDAERLYRDLQTYLGDVELFPAWETLPFERVSPNVETMGRRMRTVHRLRHDPPTVIVAPVRALVQRLGPHLEDVQSVTIRPGEQRDRDELLAGLVGVGYRREEQVEHRGEVAVRGSIVDVFPSTADRPVRIDLWGDEVDRLTEFSVTDQRSTVDLAEVVILPARELLPTAEVRARAARSRTSSTGSSSRAGRMHTSSRPSVERWSVTENSVSRSTSSPHRSTRTGRSAVLGNTSTIDPLTATSPRCSTWSSRR